MSWLLLQWWETFVVWLPCFLVWMTVWAWLGRRLFWRQNGDNGALSRIWRLMRGRVWPV